MNRLTAQLFAQIKEGQALDLEIKKNLENV
jgi:hypothetical protein